jgi:hypothetical protein
LAGHLEMPAKLAQSLAISVMELVEKSAPAWVGQGFKDMVHCDGYATKWLHIDRGSQLPWS